MTVLNKISSLLLCICLGYVGWAQTKPVNRGLYQLRMALSTSSIVIDGILDEEAWSNAVPTSKFHKVTPVDEGYPISQSSVRMTYDDQTIYIGVICYDSIPGARPVESLRRDFSFGKNDNFIAFIDTYNDQTNGFAFGVSSAGAQWDGIQADGGFVSLNWDTKWKSAVVNYEDRWVAEIAIPLSSIRYKDGATEWGINFSRLDLKTGEKSSWAPVPRQFQTANLAFTGSLLWDQAFESKGLRYSLIPYVFGQTTADRETEEGRDYTFKTGFDAKLNLSTSLNLDITVNPDFSQVEVDQQRTNLDRFELFFPERRQFFLENSDLFASLGDDGNRPFFSRRIGLEDAVIGGLRLSGKLGKKNRIGLMSMQTQEDNFSVGVFQRQFLGRSNFSLFMVHKEDFEKQGVENSSVAGIDFNLASADNKWTGKVFYHQSIGASGRPSSFTTSGRVIYETIKWKIGLQTAHIGEPYAAKVGFIQRTGITKFNQILTFKLFPTAKAITTHGPGLESEWIYDLDFSIRDRNIVAYYNWTWVNRSTLNVSFLNSYIKLQFPFDPTNTGGVPLAINSDYSYNTISVAYDSGPSKLFSYAMRLGYGGYFNGDRLSLRGELNYRIQPYGNLGIVSTYDIIDLPMPYNSGRFLLYGPKLDVTLTNSLFITTFLQYNNQIDNVNLNMRLQWRFAPSSDFFVVYTQNSFPDDFRVKNDGLAIKLSYWFN